MIAFFTAVIVMLAAAIGYCETYTCEKGFVLEQKDGKANCRNPFCDSGINFYGDAIDTGKPVLEFLMTDKNGKARPKVKGPDGKWVGWTIGAYQCPPDPLGVHPNPDYVFDNTTPMTAPKHLRIANMPARAKGYKLFNKVKNKPTRL